MKKYIEILFSLFLVNILFNSVYPANKECKLQENKCDPDEYCHREKLECTKCGKCYNISNAVITKTKGDINVFFHDIIKNYEIDTFELEKEIYTLQNNLDGSEKDIDYLNILTDDINKYIDTLMFEINEIKKDLQKIEDILEIFDGDSPEITTIRNLIQNFYRKINNIIKQIQDVKSDPQWINKLQQLIVKLENMGNFANDIDGNLPIIKNNSLKLALYLEENLNILTEDIFQNEKISADIFKEDLRIIDSEIENLKALLIKIINYFLNIFQQKDVVMNLNEDADSIKKIVTEIEARLGKLVTDEEKYLKDLQNERKYLETILKQKIDFETIEDRISKVKEKLSRLQDDLQEQQKALLLLDDNLSLKQDFLENIEKIRQSQEEWNQLLDELLTVKNGIAEIDDFETIDGIDEEILNLLKQVDKYYEEIMKYC